MRSRFAAGQFLVTCEHASNRIPPRFHGLGLDPNLLSTHIAFDRGAREIARACAGRLRCGRHEGRYSRLLVDLNRSPHNPAVIPRMAFGVRVPGNEELTRRERGQRLSVYHWPYRAAVTRDIETLIADHGRCFHLSVHTFTPILAGVERHTDIGVLYDPRRLAERTAALALVGAAGDAGWRARRNYPYGGTSDALTTQCRRSFASGAYLGIEIEVNQRVLPNAAAARSFGGWLADALRETIIAAAEPGGRPGITKERSE